MWEIFSFPDSLDIEYFISAFEANYNPGFYFRGEYHDFWEAVYVISGKLGVSADEKIFDLGEGDVIFHKPMEFHRLWNTDTQNAHLFIMSFRLSGKLAEKLSDKVMHLSGHQRELMHSLISEFAHNMGCSFEASPAPEYFPANKITDNRINNYLKNWQNDSPENLTIKYRAMLLLLEVLKTDFAIKEQKHSKSAKVYRKAVEIMEENVYGKISVEEIARRCSFSEAYIKKVFNKYSDCGIHKYFLKLKIKKAVFLLESGMSVSEASEMLSFANANYFGICFKREMGCSPANYVKSKKHL